MGMPNSVKKQIKEAQELQKALNQDPAPAAPEEKPTENLEQPAVEAKAEPKQEKKKDQSAAPVVGEEPKPDGEDWEKRFKGLQTRYNRDVSELRGQVDTANQTLEEAMRELKEMRDSMKAVETQPAPQPTELSFTEEEREQYGDAWIGMMTKIAQSSHGDLVRQVADLQQELSNVKQGVSKVEQKVVVNSEQAFFDAVARKVRKETGKDWRDINADHDFHNFLAEIVPYTGRERQEFLAEAREKLDVDTAAQFFIDYAGPSSQENEPSPVVETTPKVPEELVTPDTSGGGAPPIPEQKVYTTADIEKFYDDKRRGAYKGKEDEAKKIENDILAAGREGRIVTRRAPAYA